MLPIAFTAGIVFVVVFGIARWTRVRAAWPFGVAASLIAGCVAVALTGGGNSEPPVDELPNLATAEFRPVPVSANGYVGSDACQTCHPNQHESWHASYHRTMTQVATPKTALGDFDDVTVTTPHDGRTYHLTIEDDQLRASVETPASLEVNEFPGLPNPVTLVMSTGSHHMQVYWYATGKRRLLGLLPIVHLNEVDRWVPRTHLFVHAPHTIEERSADGLGSELGRWNSTCVRCHATNGRSRFLGDDAVDTQVAEFGISCESCHGPGEEHIAMRQRRQHGGGVDEDDPIVNPRHLSHQRSSEVCGQCHSIRELRYPKTGETVNLHGYQYRPGDVLADTMHVSGLNDETRAWLASHTQRSEEEIESDFWLDGMARPAGREFNGLQASSCYVDGTASCLSCHALHRGQDDSRDLKSWANDQLQPGMEGDMACTQCHTDSSYASVSHTHHAAESSGSRCMNCHMPYTTYAVMKAVRSHHITSPDAAVTVFTGRPDACSLCHLDRPLGWTGGHLADWYGKPMPELDDDQKSVAAGLLWGLQGDAAQRVLIAHSMGSDAAVEASQSDWMAPCLAMLLQDPYAPVRYIAHRSLRRLSGFEDFEFQFEGRPSDWPDATQRALDIWKSQTGRAGNPAVLIDASGQLLNTEFQRLYQLRNNRDVFINE